MQTKSYRYVLGNRPQLMVTIWASLGDTLRNQDGLCGLSPSLAVVVCPPGSLFLAPLEGAKYF